MRHLQNSPAVLKRRGTGTFSTPPAKRARDEEADEEWQKRVTVFAPPPGPGRRIIKIETVEFGIM